jgi:hypothetical protein
LSHGLLARGASSTFRGPLGGRAEDPLPALVRVGSGFLEAAGFQLVQGRLPSDSELDRSAPVIAVSASLASRYWPTGSAVGQTLTADRQEYSVVGIIRGVRVEALMSIREG